MNAVVERTAQPVRTIAAPVADAEQKPAGCPCLSDALAAARDKCRMAAKNGFNDYHKFKYATADEVIEVAKEAMSGTGLAVIPQTQKLVTVGDGNATIFALNRTLILSHKSGEFVPLSIEGWPVIQERGRPLDKAMAVALTCSLAYLLRDLLQMPRGDDSDMNTRDDRQHEPTPAKAPPPQRQEAAPTVGKPARSMVFRELASSIRELATLRGVLTGEMGQKVLDGVNDHFKVHRQNANECTDDELKWAADGLQKMILRAKQEKQAVEEAGTAVAAPLPKEVHPTLEREPGDDDLDDEGEGEPPPAEVPPANMALRVKLADETLEVLRQCGTNWPTIIHATTLNPFLGRKLDRFAKVNDLRPEEHDRVREWARKEKARKDANKKQAEADQGDAEHG